MALMEQCKKCLCYDKEYDDMRMTGNDVLHEDERDHAHFCPIYTDGIPERIANGQTKCESFWDRFDRGK